VHYQNDTEMLFIVELSNDGQFQINISPTGASVTAPAD
jgi:hypothetical protein